MGPAPRSPGAPQPSGPAAASSTPGSPGDEPGGGHAPPLQGPPPQGPPPQGPPAPPPPQGPPLPPPGPAPAGRRGRGRRIATVVGLLLLIAFVISATVVPLPYYAFRPGSVRDTEPLISVAGDTRVYPAEGSISYTTVSLRQTTLFGLVEAWIDDDVDVHPEEEVLGDRDAEENRSFNLALMANSKDVAAQVALEHLGYEVPVNSRGSYVLDIEPGFGAEGVLEVGDVIVAVDGEQLDEPDDLGRVMAGKAPGTTVTLEVERHTGGTSTEQVTLMPSPDDPERGIMGVLVQARGVTYDFPVDVEIDTGDVGGPSAGLAFTLGILDDLTPGELTGGVPVAVTGTISPDGRVGPVGGTGQKAAAVREAGIEVFLVPSADFEAADARAGDVEVIAVDSLDEALAALAELGGNGLDLPQLGELAAGAGPEGPSTDDTADQAGS